MEGCEQIFKDTISGTKAIRPALDKMLEQAKRNKYFK